MSATPRSRTNPVAEHPSSLSESNGNAHVRRLSAAYTGASLAFSKSPEETKRTANTYSGINGALAAASKAGANVQPQLKPQPSQTLRPTGHPRKRQATSAEVGGNGALTAAHPSVDWNRSIGPLQGAGVDTGSTKSASPSNVAAVLAAAKFTPQNTGPQSSRTTPSPHRSRLPSMDSGEDCEVMYQPGIVAKARRQFDTSDDTSRQGPEVVRGSAAVAEDIPLPTDSKSIPPTNELIKLFEPSERGSSARRNNRSPRLTAKGQTPELRSPKPIRPPTLGNAPLTAALAATQRSAVLEKGENRLRGRSVTTSPRSSQALSPLHVDLRNDPTQTFSNESGNRQHSTLTGARGISPASIQHQEGNSNRAISRPSPNVPSLRKKGHKKTASSSSLKIREVPESAASSPLSSPTGGETTTFGQSYKPVPPPPRRSGQLGSATTKDAPTRDSLHPETRPSTGRRTRSANTLSGNISQVPRRENSPATRPGGFRSPPARHMNPHLTGDSLANAIVASSLASSRVPSPTKSPTPPPLPSRHGGKTHFLFHHGHETARVPSPAKGMRQTLRKPPKSEDEEDARGPHQKKKHIMRKHPNKHHEGDRKRWRDALTERERKRYEGVWAANKGVFVELPHKAGSDDRQKYLVSNIIVRDVWKRSRLQGDILEEVWELVDRDRVKALTREEFVVGMWLVDQRLKGRKLPIRVSDSVWASVRGIAHVKIPRNKQ